MALSDLILAAGELVVILSDSTEGVVGVDTGINFGTVQLVSDLCDKAVVGQSVWFDISKATAFMIISGTKFYKLLETDISATEPTVE